MTSYDTTPTPYDPSFFAAIADGSRRSASVVIDCLLKHFHPTSVLDVGCGVGTWMAEWRSRGVVDVLGVDGSYVDRAALQIPADLFRPEDISRPLDVGRRFDLVESLEVAEHLPESSADVFVDSLVRHGDTILFSAAIPGQGGVQHINERWPSYWIAKFRARGYEVYDVMRPAIWNDDRIESWYRQNCLVFAKSAVFGAPGALDLVHPAMWFRAPERPVVATAAPGPADSALADRVDALTTLTTSAIGQLQKALASVVDAISRLQLETSVSGGRGLPSFPPELVTLDGEGRPMIGYRGGREPGGGRAEFEDVFRGSETRVRQRQLVYLPYLSGNAPVLHLGCGRGELLELLREVGVEARGIDADTTMVCRANDKGLEVAEGDAVSHLAGLPDASLGAVVSTQVIEHLPTSDIPAFVEHAFRVLRPGGAFVTESVNPHCATARKEFWIDLTHQHQVFPEVAVLLCRRAGFGEASVLFPGGSGELAVDALAMENYAVIATR